MKKWEYKRELLAIEGRTEANEGTDYTNDLNKLGNQGWELVSTVQVGRLTMGYLKREKQKSK